jgi:hypothetical protein
MHSIDMDSTLVPLGRDELDDLDASWIGSFERQFILRNRIPLQLIRDQVQQCPDGPFTHKDLKWDYRGVKGGAGVAYIPWLRYEDFVLGESTKRSDVQTKFNTRETERYKGSHPRLDTPLVSIRCANLSRMVYAHTVTFVMCLGHVF